MQQALIDWYNASLGNFLPKELFVFFVSMLPLIELRGGLIAASAFCWDARANSSSSSLVRPHCSATFSAVIPMW